MGVRDRLALSAVRRGWLQAAVTVAAIGVAAIGLAACGSSPATPGQAASAGTPAATGPASQVRSSGGALCSNAGTVDRLTVSRVNAIPANHPHFVFPATVAVSGAAQARAVAQALCALQPAPHGTVVCPVDLGISYQLDFATSERSLPPVDVRASGCEGVSGAGLAQSAIRASAFWVVLGQAMGLANPGHAVFAGSLQP